MSVFGDRAVILSNSAGSSDDKEYKKAKEIEKALGVPVLRHSEKVHQQHDKQHLPTHLYVASASTKLLAVLRYVSLAETRWYSKC